MVDILVFLLILFLIIVVAYYVLDRIQLDPQIKWIVQLVLGVIFIIVLIYTLLPMVHMHGLH
jgi:threonine/homoserine/homoserine lactone efflux protein